MSMFQAVKLQHVSVSVGVPANCRKIISVPQCHSAAEGSQATERLLFVVRMCTRFCREMKSQANSRKGTLSSRRTDDPTEPF